MENNTERTEELNTEIKKLELQIESLKKTVNRQTIQKDWRDAVEEYHPGFMTRSSKPKPYWKTKYIVSGIKFEHARGMMVTEGPSINGIKDKVVLAFALLNGGRIDFKYNKLYFRPDGRITYWEALRGLTDLETHEVNIKKRLELRGYGCPTTKQSGRQWWKIKESLY